MFPRIFTLIFLLSAVAFSRVITYVGTSENSQTEAENNAMAGIVKQISVDVNSSENFSQVVLDEESSESYSAKINLKSSVKNLKGIVLETLSFDGKVYRTKATLDTQKTTEAGRNELKKLKSKIEKLAATAAKDIQENNYGDLQDLLKSDEELLENYNRIYKEVQKWEPLDDSYNLDSDFEELKKQLIKNLSATKIVIQAAEIEGRKLRLQIKVLNNETSLENFPLTVKISKSKTIKLRTQKDGLTNAEIDGENFDENFLKVTADFNSPILKAAGLQDGVKVKFKNPENSEKKQAQFLCHFEGAPHKKICNELKKKFEKQGFEFKDNEALPELKLDVTAEFLTQKSAGKVTLETYNVTFESEFLNLNETLKSSGKNKEDAVLKAAKKIKLGVNENFK